MELSNEDLLNSAMNEEPAGEVAAQVETEQQEAGQHRDEQGRFAPREAPVQQPAEPTQPREGFVPSGRLREEREAREAAERRFSEAQADWQRQIRALEARMAPKPEPAKRPDVFENPDGFLEHGVQQAIDPVKSEVQQTREFFSRMMAEDKHGADKVKAAYDWLNSGLSTGDPEAVATYQRAMRSMHPYGDIVQAHAQRSVYQQIGNDPQAWFGKTLDERLADPKFAAEIMQKIQGSVQQGQTQGEPVFNVPPNLRRAPGARSGASESTDMSNAALMSAAMR